MRAERIRPIGQVIASHWYERAYIHRNYSISLWISPVTQSWAPTAWKRSSVVLRSAVHWKPEEYQCPKYMFTGKQCDGTNDSAWNLWTPKQKGVKQNKTQRNTIPIRCRLLTTRFLTQTCRPNTTLKQQRFICVLMPFSCEGGRFQQKLVKKINTWNKVKCQLDATR
jgi:hypothetical protein